MLSDLKAQVLEANLDLVRYALVSFTFGNVSGIDRERGIVAIKPSGVPYEKLRASDIVVTNLDGSIVEGSLKPSSDLATHLLLYREFTSIGGVAHTHSDYATGWAQAGKPIPPLGTTHADCFYGEVPVTDVLSDQEIEDDYEHNTGVAIVRRFRNLDHKAVPGILVAGHAPFTWGADARKAAYNAAQLEAIARLAYYTLTINTQCPPLSQSLQNRHYFRKHGPGATYGQ